MPTWSSGNRWLTQAEMEYNAQLVQAYGLNAGWTKNAICAILGNMEAESTINPGIWGDYGAAYGLVQWNPYTKYSEWWGPGWQNNGDAQMDRIQYEADNNEQWGWNDQLQQAPPYSLSDFLADDQTSISDMAMYWCWFYERPTNPYQWDRAANALEWEAFLDWDDPPDPPPEPPEPPEPPFPYWLLFKFRGRGMH